MTLHRFSHAVPGRRSPHPALTVPRSSGRATTAGPMNRSSPIRYAKTVSSLYLSVEYASRQYQSNRRWEAYPLLEHTPLPMPRVPRHTAGGLLVVRPQAEVGQNSPSIVLPTGAAIKALSKPARREWDSPHRTIGSASALLTQRRTTQRLYRDARRTRTFAREPLLSALQLAEEKGSANRTGNRSQFSLHPER